MKCSNASHSSPVDILAVIIDQSTRRTKNNWLIRQYVLADPSLTPQTQALYTSIESESNYPVDSQAVQVGDVVRFNRVSLRNTDSTTTIEFTCNRQTPEAGRVFLVLGCIDHHGSFLPSETPIPATMRTDTASIESLIDWYRQEKHPVASAAVLAAPPCQYRSLSQLQTCRGLLSHAVAKVTGLEQIVEERVPARSRSLAMASGRTSYCALLTDPKGTCLSFVDKPGRFTRILQHAVKTNQPVRLLRVKSTTASNEEPVLVATRETTVQITSTEEFQDKQNSFSQQHHQLTIPTQSQFASLTHPLQELFTPIIIISPIRDILIDSKSIRTDDPSEWTPTMFGREGLYHSSTLRLTTTSTSSTANDFFAMTDGSILQTLCGDQSLDDGGVDDESSWSPNFLFWLWKEQIPLRWTVGENDMSRRILRVSLPVLPSS